MLDDINVLKQRDPEDTLEFASGIHHDLSWPVEIVAPQHDGRPIDNVVIAGMGGSTLAADMLKTLIADSFDKPLEVVKDYDLPNFAGPNTLVIACSQSGNTEETISCYHQARQRGCQLAAMAAGGQLAQLASDDSVAHVILPEGGQPRMAMFRHLRAMLKLLENFQLIDDRRYSDMEHSQEWMGEQVDAWHAETPLGENYAKQLALLAVGKTPIFYGGPKSAAMAYKWKISWNESSKNTAWMGQFPEFSHNEFIGWSSHPIEKPFAVFDIVSKHDSQRIDQRMRLTNRMLSGMRPKATRIELKGDSLLQEIIWGCILADHVSTYVGILNNARPGPVELVTKFKQQLAEL